MTLKEYKIDKHSQIYMSLGLMGGMETNQKENDNEKSTYFSPVNDKQSEK